MLDIKLTLAIIVIIDLVTFLIACAVYDDIQKMKREL